MNVACTRVIKAVVLVSGLYTAQSIIAADQNIKQLWDNIKAVEPSILTNIMWHATGTKNSSLTPEQTLVWQNECKTALQNSCGTLRPNDVNSLAQPWWTRKYRLTALVDAIQLANQQKTVLTPYEFDAINQLPADIRKKIECPTSANVKVPVKNNYKNIALKTGTAFLGGALVGALIGIKSAQGPSNINQRMLIGAGGIGLGTAVAFGVPSAYKAYEQSKIITPQTKFFKQL